MLKNKPLIGNSDVGKRLRIIADTMFKTNSALADNLHVSAGVMSKYINGKINPGFGFIKKMYELGFSTSWILNGHGSMFAQNDQGQKLARKYGGESFIPPQKQMLLKLIEEDYGTVLKMCETHSYDFQRINDYLIGDDTETLYFNNCFRDTIPGKKLSAMLANSPSTNEFEPLEDIPLDTSSELNLKESIKTKVTQGLKNELYIEMITAFAKIFFDLLAKDLDLEKDPEKMRLKRIIFDLNVKLMKTDQKQIDKFQRLAQEIPDELIQTKIDNMTKDIIEEVLPLVKKDK